MGRTPGPKLALCATLLLLFCCCRVQAVPQGNRIEYVFRGDDRDPETLRAAGGFAPTETVYDDQVSYNLLAHIMHVVGDTAYVSTSYSFGVAALFAMTGGWVYRTHRLASMIDVNTALADPPFPEQHELAALGGIPWDAVEAYWQVPESMVIDGFDDVEAQALAAQYVTQYETLFIPNPYFNYARYQHDTVELQPDQDVRVLASVPDPDPETWETDEFWDSVRAIDMRPHARAFLDTAITLRHSGIRWTVGQDFPMQLWHAEGTARTLPQRMQQIAWVQTPMGEALLEVMEAGEPTTVQCLSAMAALPPSCGARSPSAMRRRRSGMLRRRSGPGAAEGAVAVAAEGAYGSCNMMLDIVSASERTACELPAGLARPLVYACKNDNAGPPCGTVETPLGQCGASPAPCLVCMASQLTRSQSRCRLRRMACRQ